MLDQYNFAELDKREAVLGITCDGAAWHRFLLRIRERGDVLSALGDMLREAATTNNFSNQVDLLEMWYNVSRLYLVPGGYKNRYHLPPSPDDFVAALTRLAFDNVPLE